MSGGRAVFLDRDGVLVEDVDALLLADQIHLLPGAAEGTRRLHAAGFALVMVTNQPIVARGMATEADVERLNGEIAERLAAAGGARLDAAYSCPHHPHADVPDYRVECDCRKPRPGLLTRAAAERGYDLARSYMVGDRPTDVLAGQRAGCRTVQVLSGRHADPPIVTSDAHPADVRPDHVAAGLREAAEWIAAQG